MRRIFLVLAVLVFAAQAMAVVTVTVSPDGSDPNKVWVTYEATGADATLGVRAFALSFTATDANIIDINDFLEGESTAGDPGYGIFIGSIVIDGDGVPTSYGNPVADAGDPDGPGQLGSSEIITEFGALYDMNVPADAPLASGTLCSLTLDDCEVLVTPAVDAFRGGIVMEDPDIAPTSVVMVAGTGDSCSVAPSCTTCKGDWDESGTVTFGNLISMLTIMDQGGTYADIAEGSPGYNYCGDWDSSGTMTFGNLISFLTILDQGGTYADITCP